MKLTKEVYCHYAGKWTQLGRNKTKCPSCGMSFRLNDAHEMRVVPQSRIVNPKPADE